MHLGEVSPLSALHPNEWYTDNASAMETLVAAPHISPSHVSEINPSALYDEYGPFDISRAPPRIFLQIPEAKQAVRDEVRGLLQNDTKGIPAGKRFHLLVPTFLFWKNYIPR